MRGCWRVTEGGLTVTSAAMAAQIARSSGNTVLANVASAVMLICWMGSALDAWLRARD